MSARWISLFRSDLRRLWSGRHARLGLGLLLAVLALQAGVGYLMVRVPPPGMSAAANWSFYLTSAFGLNSAWTTALQSQLGLLPTSGGITWGFRGPLWLTVVLGIASAPLLVLFPTMASLSLAPERENHRTEELLLAGFTPLDMLVGKGLAAVLPFVALQLILQVIEISMTGFFPTRSIPGFTAAQAWSVTLGVGALRLLSFVTLAALMVCISGACRRQRNALAASFAALFAGRIISQALVLVPWGRVVLQPTRGLVTTGIVIGLQIMAILVVGHLALRGLAEPEAAGRNKPHSHPIMEYGAEVE